MRVGVRIANWTALELLNAPQGCLHKGQGQIYLRIPAHWTIRTRAGTLQAHLS